MSTEDFESFTDDPATTDGVDPTDSTQTTPAGDEHLLDAGEDGGATQPGGSSEPADVLEEVETLFGAGGPLELTHDPTADAELLSWLESDVSVEDAETPDPTDDSIVRRLRGDQ